MAGFCGWRLPADKRISLERRPDTPATEALYDDPRPDCPCADLAELGVAL